MRPPDQEQLIRSLCSEVVTSLRAGDTAVTERLLNAHPQLRQHTEGVLDLIYTEVTTREELGQSVDAVDLKRRFPEWSERIDRLLTLHRALRNESTGHWAETDAVAGGPETTPTGHEQRAKPLRIGNFEILEEIGRGGMGVVYRARQPELNRIVAVKLLRDVQLSGENARRLIREAETVARLDHPEIVRIHGAGFHENVPWICLEYVDGGSLADRLSESTLDAVTACRILHQLACAMQYAHEQGVVHRDLKPPNVLLSRDGRPRIADFGLAKTVWECAADDLPGRLTQTGAILGSLCYMAPEQVSGQDDKVNAVTDVYGMGTILYESLTGRPPFVRESPLETAHEIQTRDPISPRTLSPSVPRDVETICLKCLEKHPQRRYQSAQELADELARFLNHEPIVARPVSRLVRICRWAARRPVHAALAISLLALVVTWTVLQWKHAAAMSVVNMALNTSLEEEAAARKQADEHFWRAFEGVTSVQRRLADAGLEHEPRMQQARLEVVDNAVDILDDLAAARPDEPRIRRELGRLLMSRGYILRELGRAEESRAALVQSEHLFEQLIAAEPHDDGLKKLRAAAVCRRAEALKLMMQYEAAEAAYAIGVSELNVLADRHPDDESLQLDLIQAMVSHLTTLPGDRRSETAERILRTKLLCEQTLNRWPESPRANAVSGQVLRAEGNLLRTAGDPSEACRAYTEACLAFQRSLELAPGDRVCQVFLVETWLSQAQQLQSLREYTAAGAVLLDADRVLTELRGRYPSIPQYQQLQIQSLGLQSLLEMHLGNEADSVALAEQAVALQRLALQQNPAVSNAAAEFGAVLANLANRLIMAETAGNDRLARAVVYAREAAEIPDTYHLDAEAGRQLRHAALYSLVLALTQQDDTTSARTELDALGRATTDTPGELRMLADAWNELLAALVRTGAPQDQADAARNETLTYLERAVTSGYRDIAELEQTPVLEHVRESPRFQALIRQLRD